VTALAHPGDALSSRRRLAYVLVLGALTALGPFTIDLYLPAFPAVQRELEVGPAAVQLTLTATSIGFALGQLVVGPWSDAVGRRVPLLIATAVHVIASLGVAAAPGVELVAALRVLQGIGAAGGGVVALAMVRDLFGGLSLVRMLARLAAISGLAPVIAPVLGSQLLRLVDWRGVFVVLAGYGCAVLAASVVLVVETLPLERRQQRERRSTRERYGRLLRDHHFVGAALIAGMTFTGLFAYLSSSSFLFQKVWQLDAQQYGVLFAVNSVGIIIGVQTSSRLVRRVGPQWVLMAASSTMLVAAATIAVLDSMHVGLLGILVPLWFFIMACGFAFPCQQVLALAHHGEEAGTAASLMGAVNFGLAGALSPVIGLFGIHDAVPMAVMMVATSTTALVVMAVVVRPRTVPALVR
jgi:MFS transporter, DHA1 family, multidrug resistance protein